MVITMRDEKMGSEEEKGVPGDESAPSLSDDELYRALSSRRRRRVLSALLLEEESTAAELATVLTGWQATEAGTMATPDDWTEVLIELRHSDLPVLDEVGFVTFDSERGTVKLESVPPAVRDLIHQSVEQGYSSRP